MPAFAVLRSDRVLASTPRKVFAAFEDRASFARFSGANGFTSTIQQFDFTPGGKLIPTLHGPGGIGYPNEYLVNEQVIDH